MYSTFLLTSLALSARATQIYLSPPTRAASGSLQVSPVDAHAILSHHLNLHFDDIHSAHWVKQLGYDQPSPFEQHDNDGALLLLITHPEGSPIDFLPESMREPALTVSTASASLKSWSELLTLYCKRAARTFDLHLSDIHGFQDWAKKAATKAESAVESWLLAPAIKLGLIPGDVKLPVEQKPEYSRLLTQLDFADSSAQTLISEFSAMDKLVESLVKQGESNALDAPYVSHKDQPQFAIMRFDGLSQIEAKHGQQSKQYQEASQAFKAMLSATLQAYEAQTSSNKVVMIISPNQLAPAHYKRFSSPGNPDLAPFRSAIYKRQNEASSPMPLVPTSKQCFADADTCKNSTDSCNGHGSCVKGLSARGGDCYVCSCSKDKNGQWSGQFCEKEDYSSSFFLLAGTGLLLFLAVMGSISLLSSSGSEDLPQVLELSTGGSKKDN